MKKIIIILIGVVISSFAQARIIPVKVTFQNSSYCFSPSDVSMGAQDTLSITIDPSMIYDSQTDPDQFDFITESSYSGHFSYMSFGSCRFFLSHSECSQLYLFANTTKAITRDYTVLAQCYQHGEFPDFNLTIHYSATTAVKNVVFDKISISPNPVKEYITIDGLEKEAGLSVYSLSGTLLLQKNITSGQAKADIKTLSNGVYIVKLNSADGAFWEGKFVKE